jgi:hypothetical protein
MAKTLRLGDKDYDVSVLSEEGRRTLALYQYATTQLQEAENRMALLTKARNAYIADLKNEIIEGRTGVDLGALFDD